jgi:murein DD-endopeptidase MepM/ murein hydrolase activator NlpD
MFLGDKKIRDGRIIAAEFINKGKTHQAILYNSPKGDSNYFTPEGYSMRKAFIRSPVDFRRISSRFQRERWHPVLGKKRPHKGVDYAAASGTPIKAAGDGKISFRGRKGGYGRTIILRHGSNITTLYAHMSSYKRGLSKGSRVKQGQVIGYVGKSGLATGPHLHYEFRVNGSHRNPLTVKLPQADPLPKRYRAEFKQAAQPLLAQLQLYKDSQLALQQ